MGQTIVTVDAFTDRPFAGNPPTTVRYAPGQRGAAQQVASIINVPRISPLDANTQAIAGPDAQVVVTVGSDRAQQ